MRKKRDVHYPVSHVSDILLQLFKNGWGSPTSPHVGDLGAEVEPDGKQPWHRVVYMLTAVAQRLPVVTNHMEHHFTIAMKSKHTKRDRQHEITVKKQQPNRNLTVRIMFSVHFFTPDLT